MFGWSFANDQAIRRFMLVMDKRNERPFGSSLQDTRASDLSD
jgi:hypothetical protein